VNLSNFLAELKRRNVAHARIDAKPAFWESGSRMKTTLDLPDDLMCAVKIRAVHEHKKLNHTHRRADPQRDWRVEIPAPETAEASETAWRIQTDHGRH